MTEKSDLNSIQIRQMILSDIALVEALQKKASPWMQGWTSNQLGSHLKVFPEGQLVAVNKAEEVVGSASSLIIDWDDYVESANWDAITSHGTFDTHNPFGKTLYGADMLVDPDYRRLKIGTMFYDARKKMIKERGLKRLLTGGRIPGYAQVSHQMTPKEYVIEVIKGKRKDPALSFQLKNGFVVLEIIADYLIDTESRGFATLLEWLNPEYVMSLTLEEKEEAAQALKEYKEEEGRHHPTRVRIAALQYLLRPISNFDDFSTQVEFFVRSAKEYKSNFVVFPEYFTMQLLSYLREPAPARAVRWLAQQTPSYEHLFKRLAMQHNLYIIAGTHPIIELGELYNAAHLFTPKGRIFRQKKVHLTPSEKEHYQMSRGHRFYVYHTEFGKIAILVCYDVEFPEAARVLAEAGAEILFVPSCTDERQAFCRVRYCSQARAIENQIYVAMAGTVGNLPGVPGMATNYSQAAILTPSDYFFARDGVAAEGNVNQEQVVVSDVDLDFLDEQRVNGTVIPLNDLIKDAYDQVFHYTDLPPLEQTTKIPVHVSADRDEKQYHIS